jgi:hypothetical protein
MREDFRNDQLIQTIRAAQPSLAPQTRKDHHYGRPVTICGHLPPPMEVADLNAGWTPGRAIA